MGGLSDVVQRHYAQYRDLDHCVHGMFFSSIEFSSYTDEDTQNIIPQRMSRRLSAILAWT